MGQRYRRDPSGCLGGAAGSRAGQLADTPHRGPGQTSSAQACLSLTAVADSSGHRARRRNMQRTHRALAVAAAIALSTAAHAPTADAYADCGDPAGAAENVTASHV